MSFNQFILREQYLKVKGLGDRLELMKEQIDWKPFVPLVRKVFFDNGEQGGRPHTDHRMVQGVPRRGTEITRGTNSGTPRNSGTPYSFPETQGKLRDTILIFV